MKIKFLSLVLLLSNPHWAMSLGGVEISGGGGHIVEIEFRQTAKKALLQLSAVAPLIQQELNIRMSRLESKLAKCKIKVTQQTLLVDSNPKTAVNQPDRNRIYLSAPTWQAYATDTGRTQLVLHELLGLAYPGRDEDFSISARLIELYQQRQIENAVLAIAQVNLWSPTSMKIQYNRTRLIGPWQVAGEDDGQIHEVYIQTFENSSDQTVRIYRVYTDPTGAVQKIEMSGFEGPIGP